MISIWNLDEKKTFHCRIAPELITVRQVPNATNLNSEDIDQQPNINDTYPRQATKLWKIRHIFLIICELILSRRVLEAGSHDSLTIFLRSLEDKHHKLCHRLAEVFCCWHKIIIGELVDCVLKS